jgi:hypothetical protein
VLTIPGNKKRDTKKNEKISSKMGKLESFVEEKPKEE